MSGVQHGISRHFNPIPPAWAVDTNLLVGRKKREVDNNTVEPRHVIDLTYDPYADDRVAAIYQELRNVVRLFREINPKVSALAEVLTAITHRTREKRSPVLGLLATAPAISRLIRHTVITTTPSTTTTSTTQATTTANTTPRPWMPLRPLPPLIPTVRPYSRSCTCKSPSIPWSRPSTPWNDGPSIPFVPSGPLPPRMHENKREKRGVGAAAIAMASEVFPVIVERMVESFNHKAFRIDPATPFEPLTFDTFLKGMGTHRNFLFVPLPDKVDGDYLVPKIFVVRRPIYTRTPEQFRKLVTSQYDKYGGLDRKKRSTTSPPADDLELTTRKPCTACKASHCKCRDRRHTLASRFPLKSVFKTPASFAERHLATASMDEIAWLLRYLNYLVATTTLAALAIVTGVIIYIYVHCFKKQ